MGVEIPIKFRLEGLSVPRFTPVCVEFRDRFQNVLAKSLVPFGNLAENSNGLCQQLSLTGVLATGDGVIDECLNVLRKHLAHTNSIAGRFASAIVAEIDASPDYSGLP